MGDRLRILGVLDFEFLLNLKNSLLRLNLIQHCCRLEHYNSFYQKNALFVKKSFFIFWSIILRIIMPQKNWKNYVKS